MTQKIVHIVAQSICSVILITLAISSYGQVVSVYAQTVNTTTSNSTVNTTLQNPLSFDTICSFVDFLVNFVTEIGAIIGVLFVIWSGFLFIKAQGNKTELEKAKKTLYTTLIGIAILLGSSVITKVIVGTIGAVLGSSSGVCSV